MRRRASALASGVSWSAALLLASLATVALGQRQDELTVSDQSLKAAYIYKFANYVEWPEDALEDAAAPITIGVLGADALGDELVALTAQRRIDTRPIVIRQLSSTAFIDGLHILFLGQQDRAQLGQELRSLGSRPILTITDVADGLSAGSVVNFTRSNSRVRFEVSLTAAERSSLRLDARLLGVAENVVRSAP